jgi:hypothetical protein
MPSIYQRALGSDFAKLHPQIQRRFSLSSESGVAAIGTGVMERVWRGAAHTLPFLYLGIWRSILYPEQATDVHFNIQNYAYRDALGRETVTWVRKFATSQVRRFDAYMVYSGAAASFTTSAPINTWRPTSPSASRRMAACASAPASNACMRARSALPCRCCSQAGRKCANGMTITSSASV